MSRKTNKIKARLRISQEQDKKREQRIRLEKATLREIETARERLKVETALAITVQTERGHEFDDVFAVRVAFSPRMFVRGMMRSSGSAVALGYHAERIGMEAGAKVAAAILETAKKEFNF